MRIFKSMPIAAGLLLYCAASASSQSGYQTIQGTRVFTEVFQSQGYARFSNDCGSQTLTQRQLQGGAIPTDIIPCPRPAPRQQGMPGNPAKNATDFEYDRLMRDVKDLIVKEVAEYNAQRHYNVIKLSTEILDRYLDVMRLPFNSTYQAAIRDEAHDRYKNQACIKDWAEIMFKADYNTNSDYCEEKYHSFMSRGYKWAVDQDRELKKPGDGKFFGAIAFADNRAFFGIGSHMRDFDMAVMTARSNCEAVERNNISTGIPETTSCVVVQWTVNLCAGTALTDDNPSYIGLGFGDNAGTARSEALNQCRTETSSTVCRPGPAFCPQNP